MILCLDVFDVEFGPEDKTAWRRTHAIY